MIRFAADENFNRNIVNGVLRRRPDTDIVCVQDVGLEGSDDPTILAWAAHENRVLLTHDVNTITAFAYDRIRHHLPMPGVFEIALTVSIGVAIQEIILLIACSVEGEWDGQINYLPLR